MSKEYSKTILIGKTENEIINIKLEIDEKHELSMSGHSYETAFFDESTGEGRAKEYLDDGESWKMAVEAGNTTEGEQDFNESVIKYDGWESVLGDVTYISKIDKYTMLGSCGQIDMSLKPKDFEQSEIGSSDLELIFKAWKKLHLKTLFGKGKYSKKDHQTVDLVKYIFDKMPEYEDDQLAKYAEDEDQWIFQKLGTIWHKMKNSHS